MERKLFGTDGVRGIANRDPITPEMVLRIGKAASRIFNNGSGRTRILIGKDTRISGYILEAALTSGICSMGSDVLLVGPMPTPAIAHLTKSFGADAGIVISASHNPAEHNGIKFFSRDGFKLPDEKELEMEKLVFSGDFGSEHINGERIGKARRIDDARGRYIEFAKSTLNNMSLSGLKVVLDCANGACYSVAPTIFRELGADVISLNDKPDGLNINRDCGALHPEVIRKAVMEHNADIGIALDGDGDRVMVVDERGEEFDGDFVMALCGLEMKKQGRLRKDTIATTVMSNIGLDIFCRENGINLVKTDVGDRYVLEAMLREGLSFGGEQSGHIFFMNHITTGDGIITALQIMGIMKRSGKRLSELRMIEKLPQVLLNIEVKEKKDLSQISNISDSIREAEKTLGDEGRILVRYSGTENTARVMLEGKDPEEIRRLAEGIGEEIKKEIGVDSG